MKTIFVNALVVLVVAAVFAYLTILIFAPQMSYERALSIMLYAAGAGALGAAGFRWWQTQRRR